MSTNKEKRHGSSRKDGPKKLVRNKEEEAITRTVLAALALGGETPATAAEEAAFRKKFGPNFVNKLTKIASGVDKRSARSKKKPDDRRKHK